MILPDMPIAQPLPSPGLIAAVKRYLDRRRVLCTRIEVAAPAYLVITVTASVQALTGASIAGVQSAIVAGLNGFPQSADRWTRRAWLAVRAAASTAPRSYN